ncbi:MAG TPA: exosortase/archaeosortase family protein [Tepidisphaeraceae bacterium]|nr:exosortase/archaeosortase family protein [Tepidisphaeraceae bacterium]
MSTFASNRTADIELNPSLDPHHDEPVYFGARLSTWIKVATIAALFGLLFWPNLVRLWAKTNPITGEDNWKHAPFVPLLGLYYLYVNREQLAAARVKASWSGLPIMLGGILIFAWAIWPLQNDWFKDLGMVITLFGVVTLLCGWEVMKTAWFPIVFLICALPWPGLFYSALAGPLQEFAARIAVRLMNFVGVTSGQYGTKIFVDAIDNKAHVIHTLNVEEACAGLRSLMTFVSIAAAVAFLSYRPLWQKLVMVFSAIPIAIFCNTMRVTMQGILAHYASLEWAEGAAHGFVGLVMMIPAFFLILLVGWVLENMFIEEVDDKKALRDKSRANSSNASGGGRPTSRSAAAATPASSTPRPTVAAIAAARAQASRQAPARVAPAASNDNGAAPVSGSVAAAPAANHAAPAVATTAVAGAAIPKPVTTAGAGTSPASAAAPTAPRKVAAPAAGTAAPVRKANPAPSAPASQTAPGTVKRPGAATPSPASAPAANTAKPAAASVARPSPAAAKPAPAQPAPKPARPNEEPAP